MATPVHMLTERERETLRLLLVGHDAKSIARALGLSVHTVNDRLREARRKLGVSSSREAARLLAAAEAGAPIAANPQIPAPQFSAPRQFGIAHTPPAPQIAAHPNRRYWLAGGTVMIVALAAAALLTLHDETPVPASAAAEALAPLAAASAPAARAWLALLDQADWPGSWRQAGTIFRNALTSEAWAGKIGKLRQPLGAARSRRLASVTRSTSLPGAPDGEYEILQFRTLFAHGEGRIETVVLAHEPDGWRVDGYFMRLAPG